MFQHPIPKEQGEQSQIKNNSQSQEQSIEQNESTILTQEDQENVNKISKILPRIKKMPYYLISQKSRYHRNALLNGVIKP